jgi:hypothetical protein
MRKKGTVALTVPFCFFGFNLRCPLFGFLHYFASGVMTCAGMTGKQSSQSRLARLAAPTTDYRQLTATLRTLSPAFHG